MIKPDISINICGIKIKNPVISASGTFGFGRELCEYNDLNLMGGIGTKGITLMARQGNPSPRIAETPSGILNSVGLQNPGVRAFLDNEMPFLKQFNTPLFVNISANSPEEYGELTKIIDDRTEYPIAAIEVNVSCPNIRKGGAAFGTSVEGIKSVTKCVREATKLPIFIKLTPNVTDIAECAKAAEAAGADGISLINTVLGMAIDVRSRRPILANNMGGLSGPAVKPIAVRMVYQVAQAVNIPIIGMGGISTAADIIEFMLAGASAVMVGTMGLTVPSIWTDIVVELENYCIENKIEKLTDLIGGVIMN